MQLASSVVCLFRVVNALISKGRCGKPSPRVFGCKCPWDLGRCSIYIESNLIGVDALRNKGGCSWVSGIFVPLPL